MVFAPFSESNFTRPMTMESSTMLAKFSIRTTISALVATLLITIVAVGGLGLLKMRALHASTVDVAESWLPSVRVLGDLRFFSVSYRNYVREHMLGETLEQKNKTEARLTKLADNIATTLKAYEKLITSPEERALYQGWSETWASYMATAAKVMELSRKEVGTAGHEAHTMAMNVLSPIGTKADGFLDKDVDLNNKGAEAAAKDAGATYDAAFLLVIAMLSVAVAVGTVVGFSVVRGVSQCVAAIVTPMQAFTRGDLTAEVPHRGEATEIGSMADALQIFKEALIAKRAADEAAAREAEEKIARGQRIDAATRDFESAIGEIVDTVSSASIELEASAGTLTATAGRAQELTSIVASASEEASSNVQSVASATEEMSSSITEISRQVQESARIAGEAVDQAQKTNDSVGQLSQAASRIGDVVELINTIAGQTNLLALNATIEAARAGEAGRGFAVVASEVKALAEQTAKATGEISQQITGIQSATQESVGAIKAIGATIGRMSEIASTIASAVEEQGAATQEISRNVQQAAMGTQGVSANIADVERGAAETGSASTQVLSAAQSLSQDSNRLKLEVSKFLHTVRAA
jgi:methyl-accepting chemotaxis protein